MSRETGNVLSSDDESSRERNVPCSRATTSHVARDGSLALERRRVMLRETGALLSSDDESCRERRAPGSRAMASHVASYGRPALKRQRIGAGLAIRKDPAMKTTALALGL